MKDDESLKNINKVLHDINEISSSKFDSQLESEETIKLHKNFYEDKRWQEWLKEVENLSFY